MIFGGYHLTNVGSAIIFLGDRNSVPNFRIRNENLPENFLREFNFSNEYTHCSILDYVIKIVSYTSCLIIVTAVSISSKFYARVFGETSFREKKNSRNADIISDKNGDGSLN